MMYFDYQSNNVCILDVNVISGTEIVKHLKKKKVSSVREMFFISCCIADMLVSGQI